MQSINAAVAPAWTEDVLDFWFSELGAAHWFEKSAATDALIRKRFLALHEQLVTEGGCNGAGPRALLASVIVLDQFSRNMFRDTSRAYAADPIARDLARQAISQRYDLEMNPHERMFLYLPFEHSEDREDQALSVQLTSSMGNEQWTRYAIAHQAIIERFGRFPHRNAILGRESTAEELAALKEPMGSF